jgi:hypothetical protein
MSPFDIGIMGFLFKQSDVGANFLRSQGYGREITRAYSDYSRYSRMLEQPGLSAFHKDNIMKRVQAAEGILQKGLKGSDWKTLYKGREGLQPALAERGAFKAPKDVGAATGAGRAAVFEGQMRNQPGGEARLEALRQQTQAGGRQQAQSRMHQPLAAKDKAVQEYMMTHKGKAPKGRVLNRLMRSGTTSGGGGPTRDWTWKDRPAEVKGKSQPYYGGQGQGGAKIHTSPQTILPGEPGAQPMKSPPIPGTRAHAVATGKPAPPPRGMPTPIPTAPSASKLFGNIGKRMGRYGRGAAVVGGLGLGAYLLGRDKKQEQVKPVYGPMPSPLATAGYY